LLASVHHVPARRSRGRDARARRRRRRGSGRRLQRDRVALRPLPRPAPLARRPRTAGRRRPRAERDLDRTRGGTMSFPYAEPLVAREPGERVIPEPPRRGEPGGPPCAICGGKTTSEVWSDAHWTLHPPVGGSLPGAIWIASREHFDSFAD